MTMYVIKKVHPETEHEKYYRMTTKDHEHIYIKIPEQAEKFPTRKLALEKLNLIKPYGVDLIIEEYTEG